MSTTKGIDRAINCHGGSESENFNLSCIIHSASAPKFNMIRSYFVNTLSLMDPLRGLIFHFSKIRTVVL